MIEESRGIMTSVFFYFHIYATRMYLKIKRVCYIESNIEQRKEIVMGKEHSHDVIRRLIAGKEEDVMRGLLSIDRIFERKHPAQILLLKLPPRFKPSRLWFRQKYWHIERTRRLQQKQKFFWRDC